MLIPPATAGDAWTERTLWIFGSVAGDGESPNQVIAHNGALFGTTIGGGASRGGTVFQLTPPATSGASWTETILHAFTFGSGSTDGNSPNSGVIVGPGGALYGTTLNGGAGGDGAAYSVTP